MCRILILAGESVCFAVRCASCPLIKLVFFTLQREGPETMRSVAGIRLEVRHFTLIYTLTVLSVATGS